MKKHLPSNNLNETIFKPLVNKYIYFQLGFEKYEISWKLQSSNSVVWKTRLFNENLIRV